MSEGSAVLVCYDCGVIAAFDGAFDGAFDAAFDG